MVPSKRVSGTADELVTVITGDLVSSTGTDLTQEQVARSLSDVFRDFGRFAEPNCIFLPFEIFRGDSFQGVLRGVESSLLAALYLRCSIRHFLELDVRQAIGIGLADDVVGHSTRMSSGQAFLRSGRLLDSMNSRQSTSRLLVSTEIATVDEELNTLLTVFDAIVRRWTEKECEAVLLKLHNWTQADIAEYLQINQSAVHKRLKSADFYTVQIVLERWDAAAETVFLNS